MKYVIFALLLFVVCAFPRISFAQENNEDFAISGVFIYEFTQEGTVRVREEMTIRNLKTEAYAPSFSFDVSGFNPHNVVAYESGLTSKLSEEDTQKFKITFKNPVLGKGAKKSVAITFEDDSLAQKKGDVWEIHIPKIQNGDRFDQLTTLVRVPKELGPKLHIFPHQEGVVKGQLAEYSFGSEISKTQPITAFLGDVAAYDFTLKYPLTNTTHFAKQISFAIPPDTAFQKVYLLQAPEKLSLTYDLDGNWIGSTQIPAMQTKVIEVSGTIFVFADAVVDFPKPSSQALAQNTSSLRYWEANEAAIAELAKEYNTPEKIYKYVVNTLSYDYTKISRPQERLGAVSVLSQKNNAICMEFTDLFIAISRAAGIPAREINGFALSNDKSKPRDLGLDILHSWPEYWDPHRQIWIPVDPTWGNTTGGVDYFSHLDLSHIPFVIHGVSSTTPQTPGTYKATESETPLISVAPAQNPQVPDQINPEVSIQKSAFGLFHMSYFLQIKNDSPQALYNIPVGWKLDSGQEHTTMIAGLLPFSTYTMPISMKVGFFGADLPRTLSAQVGGKTQSVTVTKVWVVLLHISLFLTPIVLIPISIILFMKHYEKH